MQRCQRLPADAAPVRSSGCGERDRTTGAALTIQIVVSLQSSGRAPTDECFVAPKDTQALRRVAR
jgi:hypothetical protein